jgi:hypothetical protein
MCTWPQLFPVIHAKCKTAYHVADKPVFQYALVSGCGGELSPCSYRHTMSPCCKRNVGHKKHALQDYIASDADYVNYITELMGDFVIPDFLKEYRKGKQYLFIGLPLHRDSERMVMGDIVMERPNEKTGY